MIKGYDGNPIKVGDRVELHPGTDHWMMGYRYGTIVEQNGVPYVILDYIPNERISFNSNSVRKI